MGRNIRKRLLEIYDAMYGHFGPRGWWPGETDFEICVGAILTQSVAWKNVSRAIENLKQAGLLDVWAMYRCPVEDIETCIVPTMYYRMKAKKLKAFVSHVAEIYNGDLRSLLDKDLDSLRTELLGIYGIGPETADSIILYASRKPVFVVDAYTRRIFSRLGFWDDSISYDGMQSYFMRNLPLETPLFNEYHALIVGTGNRYCANKRPKCEECPVGQLCQGKPAEDKKETKRIKP